MPIYGYECKHCGNAFEMLIRASENPACPSWESTELTRQLSLIATPAKNSNEAPMCDGAGGCGMCSPGIWD